MNELAPDEKLTVAGITPISVQKDESTGLPLDYIRADGLSSKQFTKTWIVQGVIEDGRAYQWFGQWKSGKTLAVLDICCHASLGKEWAGKRTFPTLIIWVASESCEDVMRRMAAWQLAHKIDSEMPFVIRTKPLHLDVAEFASLLEAEIKAIKERFPFLPVVCVIDTVARSMSGDLSENDEGLRKFANNMLDLVVRQTGCAAIFVHHSGHGDKERGRGWSGFPGAVDGTVKVSMEKQVGGPSFVDVSMTEMRSGKGDDSFRFRVDIQEINGTDNCGDVLEEPVLLFQGSIPSKKSKPSGKNQRKVLEQLTEMCEGENGGKVLRDALRLRLVGKEDGQISSEAFRDAVDSLLTGLFIREDRGFLEVLP